MKKIKEWFYDSDKMFFTMMSLYVISGFIVVINKSFPPDYCTCAWIVCMSLYIVWYSYIRKS